MVWLCGCGGPLGVETNPCARFTGGFRRDPPQWLVPPCSSPVDSKVSFPRLEEEIGRFWKEQADLREVAGRAGRRPAVRVLRGPADGQRAAPSGPLPDPGHQGPLPPLPHHAGLPLRPQGRLGHARAARRGRGLQGAGHPLQGGDRGVRRRAVHPQVPGERLSLHPASGSSSPSGSASGSSSTRPTSPTTRATWRASGGP